jgi:hypothetical protein
VIFEMSLQALKRLIRIISIGLRTFESLNEASTSQIAALEEKIKRLDETK